MDPAKLELTAYQLVLLKTVQEIRDLLQVFVEAATQAEEEPPSMECPHAEDDRINLRTLADPEAWICRRCKYEHHGLVRN